MGSRHKRRIKFRRAAKPRGLDGGRQPVWFADAKRVTRFEDDAIWTLVVIVVFLSADFGGFSDRIRFRQSIKRGGRRCSIRWARFSPMRLGASATEPRS
jgi:hypothetical protein